MLEAGTPTGGEHDPDHSKTGVLCCRLQAAMAACKRLILEAGAALLAVLRREVGVAEAFVSVLLQDTAFTGEPCQISILEAPSRPAAAECHQRPSVCEMVYCLLHCQVACAVGRLACHSGTSSAATICQIYRAEKTSCRRFRSFIIRITFVDFFPFQHLSSVLRRGGRAAGAAAPGLPAAAAPLPGAAQGAAGASCGILWIFHPKLGHCLCIYPTRCLFHCWPPL